MSVNSSLHVWKKSPMEPPGPALLSVGSFLITVSLSLLVIGLFIFSISSWFSLERYTFLRLRTFLFLNETFLKCLFI